MDVPDVFNSGQSQASGSNESRYLVQFGNGDSSLRLAFNRLSPRSTALSPDEIILRAQALVLRRLPSAEQRVAGGRRTRLAEVARIQPT